MWLISSAISYGVIPTMKDWRSFTPNAARSIDLLPGYWLGMAAGMCATAKPAADTECEAALKRTLLGSVLMIAPSQLWPFSRGALRLANVFSISTVSLTGDSLRSDHVDAASLAVLEACSCAQAIPV